MKIDRLLGIITTLLQKDKVTAPYLAEKFEVSRRTILRDLDDICLAGIPIVTTQGPGGGISIAEGFRLDKSVLTSAELQSILTGLKSLEVIEQPSNLERLMQKLSLSENTVVSLRDSIVIDLASNYKNSLSEKVALIKEAIGSKQLIAFDYYYSKGTTRRKIEPYLITFRWSGWYVFGFCTKRQDFRAFKLNRLWALTVTGERFTGREIPDGKLTIGMHEDENEITVLFDGSVRYRLIEDYGFECFTEQDDGTLLFHIGYSNKDYILSWLLAFGDKATVLEPPELAGELRRIAERMIENYQRT
jgi:predicted DNA-binding transcriptional regulator YafY